MKPLLKKNRFVRRYSTTLTRWLHKLNQFEFSNEKKTEGAPIKVTDCRTRNSVELTAAEKKMQKEVVIKDSQS